ncbi:MULTISPECIES: GNAT family N-acetyltransferase [unclassified Vibrio]|uniref:GNAT family N-acetyltransferase n=1 Tax=Vibrio sp. HB236076 TaxID=3232307 RepID=A0AB39HD04_9VIBR|nr:GNAT family N-acetyltransferase [Vibrio sp. HB161653]MDP5253451.1 GNAT family N-acetyltransferase [Vibrio sp. HB161653]
MHITKATLEDLDSLIPLFDLYRQFYGQSSDLIKASAFITERLQNLDSTLFIAFDDTNAPIGFVQLYPSFSSVAMKRMWYLNDLFVIQSARKQGVAKALLNKVKEYAETTNALTVKLATASDNFVAKKLYESEGYSKVVAFEHYTQRVE